MDTGICKHCGKEGTWDRFPYRGSTITILKHYCPVKVAEKKAKKEIEIQKNIDRMLRLPMDQFWVGYNLHTQAIIQTKFPAPDISDYFREWTEEEYFAEKKFKAAVELFQKKVYDFIKEKRKIPTDKGYEKIANQVIKEIV